MKAFNIMDALRNIESSDEISCLEIHCNRSRDRQKVDCINKHGKIGTAVLFLSRLPLELRQLIIANNGDIIGISLCEKSFS